MLQTNNTYLVISKDIVSYTERIIQLQCCSGNGLCNSNGTCSCNQNYYHYDCSVFCSPAQCREHMHCSEFGCVCDENYYGPSCDIFCNSSLCSLDSHGICSFIGCICSPNYYGEYCSTFCEPSATCNSEGICNEQGECECENEWHNVYLFDGPTCLPITLNVSLILVLAGIFVGTFIFLWIGIIWYSKTRTFHKNRYNISLPATEKTALLIEENTLQKDLSRNRNFLIMRAFWSISWLVFVDITILIIELCLRSQLGLNNTTFYGYLSWMPSVFGLVNIIFSKFLLF